MKRISLYYPLLFIPDDSWIRSNLLYYDQISTIIPKKVWDESHCVGFSKESGFGNNLLDEDGTDFLLRENQYKPIFPDILLQPAYRSIASDFENEYYHRLSFLDDCWGYGAIKKPKIVLISSFAEYLELSVQIGDSCQHLLHCIFDSGDGPGTDRIPVIMYMSVLASFLAENDSDLTTPSTDCTIYRDFIYLGENSKSNLNCFSLEFHNILPIPDSKTPLEKIVDFKKDHRTELIRLSTPV